MKYHTKDVSDVELDIISQPLASNPAGIGRTVQLEDFHVTASEQSAVDKVEETLFSYVLMKEASLFVDLKTFCGMVLCNVVYLSTHLRPCKQYSKTTHRVWDRDICLLVGDKKIYARICELKHTYYRLRKQDWKQCTAIYVHSVLWIAFWLSESYIA